MGGWGDYTMGFLTGYQGFEAKHWAFMTCFWLAVGCIVAHCRGYRQMHTAVEFFFFVRYPQSAKPTSFRLRYSSEAYYSVCIFPSKGDLRILIFSIRCQRCPTLRPLQLLAALESILTYLFLAYESCRTPGRYQICASMTVYLVTMFGGEAHPSPLYPAYCPPPLSPSKQVASIACIFPVMYIFSLV